ncbi:MAG: endonuclease MutS2 [Chloroflexota bacterium]
MDTKTLTVLEYPKILDRLAGYCAFSASAALARDLRPATVMDEVCRLQQETREARLLLDTSDATIGGAHDVRPQVELARRGGVLDPGDILDIKSTLISARELKKLLEKKTEQFPRLAEIAVSLPAALGLVEAISRVLSDKGEVLDSASPKLAGIRAQVRVAHERLMAKLQKYLTDSKTTPMLQDALITQRDGRYVIPLRSEFKGQIKSIVHDQSSSGATLFVEPLAVVELNNEWRELQLAERDEERRVLAELCWQVAAHADEITWGVEALALLDLAFAKAKYAEATRANEPVIQERSAVSGQPSNPGKLKAESRKLIRLYQARHPLLDPKTVVAIDFDLPNDTRAVVITGPNTGGKTVALKTVGLLILMAQSGLHLPAQSGSELSVFEALYADIGDEQSIEQSLSTFSGHVTNIIRILEQADEKSLVILDELGAGTDPQEGAALARAILSHLLGRGITTLVTTHHPELKTFAHVTDGVVNASVEFDIRTLRPTFQLTIGLPGRSNALAIAQRLGLDENILAAARSEVSPDDLRADKLLDDIHRQRKLAFKERNKAEKARGEAHKLRRELAEKMEKIEDERLAILDKAREEAEAQAAALRSEIQELRRELQRARQPLEALKPVIEQAEVIEEKVQKKAPRKKSPIAAVTGPLRLGEKVTVRSLGRDGVVTALSEEDAEVQVGALRVRAKLGDLQRKVEEPPAVSDQPESGTRTSPVSTGSRPSGPVIQSGPGMELDLRGQMSEDALDKLDRYLEQAFLTGMPFVRIIHGKGTGKLRQAVREMLRGHPHVASFEEGGEKEGGAGVTVAKLAG